MDFKDVSEISGLQITTNYEKEGMLEGVDVPGTPYKSEKQFGNQQYTNPNPNPNPNPN